MKKNERSSEQPVNLLSVKVANDKFAGGWLMVRQKPNKHHREDRDHWVAINAIREAKDDTTIIIPKARYWVQHAAEFNGCHQFIGESSRLIYCGNDPLFIPPVNKIRLLPSGTTGSYEQTDVEYRLFAPSVSVEESGRPAVAKPITCEEVLARFGRFYGLVKPVTLNVGETTDRAVQVVQLSGGKQSWSPESDRVSCEFADRFLQAKINVQSLSKRIGVTRVTADVYQVTETGLLTCVTTIAEGAKVLNTTLDAIYAALIIKKTA